MGATNCPETPRQKMIGMMYLMLTCMLALNVSKDILDAFVIVNNGLEKTNTNFSLKNGFTYQAFAFARTNDPVKVAPYFDAAQVVKKMALELDTFLRGEKIRLIMKTDGVPKVEAEKREKDMKLFEGKDNRESPEVFMLNNTATGSSGEARVIKDKLIAFKKKMFELLNDPKIVLNEKDKVIHDLGDLGVKTDDNKEFNPDKPEEKYWETSLFSEIPCAATLTLLTHIQSQVKNAEATMIQTLYGGVGSMDIKTDTVAPKVIPKSNYLISGDKYQADLFIAAFSSTDTSSVVEIGDSYDSVNGKLLGNVQKLKVKRGVARYETSAGVGSHKYAAVINVFNSTTGKYKAYPVKSGGKYAIEYNVAPPMAVVSPTKMNVFYIGVDNPVEISVPGFRDDQVSAVITNGTLTKGKDGWIARVTTPGKCTISVSAKDDKGSSKPMGTKEFRVRPLPDPFPCVADKKGGAIQKSLLAAQLGVIAKLENFEFDLKFNVTSFTVSATIDGFEKSYPSSSNRFTNEQLSLISKVGRGKKLYIEDVKAVGPDNKVRSIGTIQFRLD